MNPALAARVRQLQAEADHHRAVREFRARRRYDEQQQIRALLSEVVAVLAAALEAGERHGRPRPDAERFCACGEMIRRRSAYGEWPVSCDGCATPAARRLRESRITLEQADRNRAVLASAAKGRDAA